MKRSELYSRQQISVANAASAASSEARCSHLGLATAYADRIRKLDLFETASAAGAARPAPVHVAPVAELDVALT